MKTDLDAAKQGYYAYFGAYAYGHDSNTNYVSCQITGISGGVVYGYTETWMKEETQEQETENI